MNYVFDARFTIVEVGNASLVTMGPPGPMMEYNMGGGRPLVHP